MQTIEISIVGILVAFIKIVTLSDLNNLTSPRDVASTENKLITMYA